LSVIFYALFSPLLADDGKIESVNGVEGKAETKKDASAMEAGPAAELDAARKENAMLRKELADVLSKCDEIFREYRRLQSSIAGTMANSEVKNAGGDELKSLETFSDVRKELKVLISKSVELSQFADSVLEKDGMSDTDKARLKHKLGEWKAEAERLNAMLSPPETKEKADRCRILSVNDKLQVVLLDAGTANGVNTGLIWKVMLKDGRSAKLKVVAARPFISAAAVVEGDFGSLAPGMAAAIGEK